MLTAGSLLLSTCAFAAQTDANQICPRMPAGSTLQNPPELRSHNGVLELTLHFRYQATTLGQGPPRYCYVTDAGVESPTLRLNPGDQLIIHFHNDLPAAAGVQPMLPGHDVSQNGACNGGAMNAAVTNLHFHGLSVPPSCHQDDVLRTAISSGEEFDYRTTIPPDEPPGLYWYHPHPHGYSERQVQGGASGALIVEGLEKVDPWLANMPERVIVLRDQSLGAFRVLDAETPAWDISVNYVQVTYPRYELPTIQTKPGQKELWRVLNAGGDTIFNLHVMSGGVAQPVRMVAMDGVPIVGSSPTQTGIALPPGSRAEFVVETPKNGQTAQLMTTSWDTGPEGDRDPARPIANVVSSENATEPGGNEDSTARTWQPPKLEPPVMLRRLYFSQMTPNPLEADTSIFYFITVLGQTPAAYHMGQPPNIVLHEGSVEDWIVENRSREDHVFHIHQIHFRVMEIDGKPVHDDALHDTMNVPHWDGSGPYPSVKLRMDFRDPNVVGTFLYHCHILKHEDMGMMGVIQVLPAGVATTTTLKAPTNVSTATLVNLVAIIAGKGGNGGPPGGTVQFTIDGVTSARAIPVINGQATFPTSFDSAGIHAISASYSGDTAYNQSASHPLKLHVSE